MMEATQTYELSQVSNVRVREMHPLLNPAELIAQQPGSKAAYETVLKTRQTVHTILQGQDHRPIVIVGPCSIHDPEAALDYAQRLKALADALADRLYIIMRVYFEKPRTTVGWKGLINDPDLNGSFKMEKGLSLARKLLIEINDLGLPTATEILEPLTPHYIGDLLGWVAVGARTTESQTHRQLASGLSAPVGFKNSTDGNLQVAVDAILSAAKPHTFLGINDDGIISTVVTNGNEDTHLILRGGKNGTNYQGVVVSAAAQLLEASGLPPRLMIDCSHANSGKKHRRQLTVFHEIIEQICADRAEASRNGSISVPPKIIGLMLESNINEGQQKVPADLSQLKYGLSITDECIDWRTTEALLWEGYNKLG